MSLLNYEERVIKIAKEIMVARPGVHPKSAIREAKDIARVRDKYRVTAEEKDASHQGAGWDEVPDFVKATIQKQKLAAVERKKSGRQLAKVRLVLGGRAFLLDRYNLTRRTNTRRCASS